MRGSPGSGINASIESLPAQIREGWRAGFSLTLPSTYRSVTSAIISGMGGSSLGGHVMTTSCADRLNIPVELVNGYDLPAYAGPKTLVVLSSYSGTTEETLASAKQAAARKAKCVAITTGGELARIAKAKRWPLLTLDATHNPSNQPRMGVGSSAMALHGIFASLDFLKLSDREVKHVADAAAQDESSAARTLAKRIKDRIVFLIAAEHLVGATHVTTNQINENAKRMATCFALPEFNHHFLEALTFPKRAGREIVTVLFDSKAYHARNHARIGLTADRLRKNGIEPIIVTLNEDSKLKETWRLIRLGASTSLELAHAAGVNPEPVPEVEAFKRALADIV